MPVTHAEPIPVKRSAAMRGTLMLMTVVLLGLTLVAAVTDVLHNKIYNWNTYGGILAGLAFGATSSLWLWTGGAEARTAYWLGSPVLQDCALGLVICGALMIVSFVLFPGIGGGDVKLMAMVGTLLGMQRGLEALLWTFVLGACFGLIGLIWRVGPVTTVSRVVRMFATKMRLPWFRPLEDDERKTLKPPIFLAPSALAAVVIVRFGLVPM